MQTPPSAAQPMRYYHLIMHPDLLGGWTVIRQWGQTGRGGSARRMHYTDQAAAQAAMIDARDAQVARGYRVVFVEGPKRPSRETR